MNNPSRGIKVSIRGDESLIKPKDIIKIIDILNNLENYEMLEELIKWNFGRHYRDTNSLSEK